MRVVLPVLLVLFVLMLAASGMILIVGKAKRLPASRILFAVLICWLAVYLIALVYVTILSRSSNDAAVSAVNLIPFRELLSMGVIPVVNENDTVETQELEGKNFGDNDAPSAVVAGLCGAQGLIILTDIDGLYDSDPRKNPQARRIPRVEEITPAVEELAGGAGSNRGTGGMATKLKAAKLAKSQGIPTAVISGRHTETLYQLLRGEDVGTVFPV